MCKCHEEDFNCQQGKICPARMPVQYAEDEPYDAKTLLIAALVVIAIFVTVTLAAMYGRDVGYPW